MPIISHSGAHSSVATNARQERISLGLATLRRKITVSPAQTRSRLSRATSFASRTPQVLTPAGSQCPSPRISTVTPPNISPSGGPSTAVPEVNPSLDSLPSRLVQRKVSTVVSPVIFGTDEGDSSRKTSGGLLAPPSILISQSYSEGPSFTPAHSRSASTSRAPISIRIEGPSESPDELSLTFRMQSDHQLLGVDAMAIPMKKHSTSARVTNLRAQAEQLRRMRPLTERRPIWLSRLIEGTVQYSTYIVYCTVHTSTVSIEFIVYSLIDMIQVCN